MNTATFAPRTVLADYVPGTRVRNAVLICAGALLTVLGAQISIPIPPSPVPVTGQTLAVVIAGTALGMRRGMLSQLLYLCLGLLLPVYADGGQGTEVLFGATGGYIVGFVLAAGLVGWFAEQGFDRKPVYAFAGFVAGQLAIFGIGVPWLHAATDLSWSTAIHEGFTIFIIGGLIKAAVAGLTVPAAWRFVRKLDAADDER